jgi:hypothetical protein
MQAHTRLAEDFDRSRSHLRAVAYRMLGSAEEADGLSATGVTERTGWVKALCGRRAAASEWNAQRPPPNWTDRAARHRRRPCVPAGRLRHSAAVVSVPEVTGSREPRSIDLFQVPR